MNYKQEIIRLANIMEEKGYVDAKEGNLSIYDRESNKLYITPTKKRKSELTEDMIAVLDFDTEEQLEGSVKASSEYRLHKEAYKARPDCNACVHCHSTYLTIYAVQCKPIQIKSNTIMKKICNGYVPCIPFGMPGTTHIADGLAEVLKTKDVCILGNHGFVCVGPDLEKTVAMHESLEKAVKIDTLCRILGGTPVDVPPGYFNE